MTTDDGLKGLTDEQITAFFDYVDDERGNAAKAHYKSADSYKSWESKRTGIIANAARAWLAANVHDSGDSDAARYRFCRDNWSKLTTATLYGERGHYVEQIYLNTFGLPLLPESIDAAIDAAILAEKGEV